MITPAPGLVSGRRLLMATLLIGALLAVPVALASPDPPDPPAPARLPAQTASTAVSDTQVAAEPQYSALAHEDERLLALGGSVRPGSGPYVDQVNGQDTLVLTARGPAYGLRDLRAVGAVTSLPDGSVLLTQSVLVAPAHGWSSMRPARPCGCAATAGDSSCWWRGRPTSSSPARSRPRCGSAAGTRAPRGPTPRSSTGGRTSARSAGTCRCVTPTSRTSASGRGGPAGSPGPATRARWRPEPSWGRRSRPTTTARSPRRARNCQSSTRPSRATPSTGSLSTAAPRRRRSGRHRPRATAVMASPRTGGRNR